MASQRSLERKPEPPTCTPAVTAAIKARESFVSTSRRWRRNNPTPVPDVIKYQTSTCSQWAPASQKRKNVSLRWDPVSVVWTINIGKNRTKSELVFDKCRSFSAIWLHTSAQEHASWNKVATSRALSDNDVTQLCSKIHRNTVWKLPIHRQDFPMNA
jgi:hypothetical protein